MTPNTRRLAIVCQPWDMVARQTSNSIVIVAYQFARRLARDWHVTLYGRRGAEQKYLEMDDESVEFRRFKVLGKPQTLVSDILSVWSCYRRIRGYYLFSYAYHILYALRVAVSIRRSRYDAVLVVNFLQFASIIRLFNPSATICLYMHCEWLTQFATAASERRLRRVDLVIGCSDHITEAIKARFPMIASRCHTVYNGVDTARFCPLPAAPNEKSEGEVLQGERPQRLLFAARLSPEKGVHVLIQAFKILAESRPTLRLDLIGHAGLLPYLYLAPDLQDRAIASIEPFYGNRPLDMVRRQLVQKGRAYLADLAAEAAGDDRIVFHGGVMQAGTIDFYRHATVLVFPSVLHEAFGLPTIEASACGLPVVATHSGGVPEVVEDGRTGILVPRGDARELALAIGRVLDDPALARAMGEAGRQRAVERFSWDAVSRRLAEVIGSVSPESRQLGKLTLSVNMRPGAA
jgi:glycosyltransferase involved in cell wall biosynthesis